MAASPDPIEDGEGYATSMAWCKYRDEDEIGDKRAAILVGFAALSVAGCYQKGSLEGSRVCHFLFERGQGNEQAWMD